MPPPGPAGELENIGNYSICLKMPLFRDRPELKNIGNYGILLENAASGALPGGASAEAQKGSCSSAGQFWHILNGKMQI